MMTWSVDGSGDPGFDRTDRPVLRALLCESVWRYVRAASVDNLEGLRGCCGLHPARFLVVESQSL
jgi:hypothetical protein